MNRLDAIQKLETLASTAASGSLVDVPWSIYYVMRGVSSDLAASDTGTQRLQQNWLVKACAEARIDIIGRVAAKLTS